AVAAVGAVPWESRTGKPLPTDLDRGGPQLPRLPAPVGSGVSALVADLTAIDPAARPGSAARVAERAGELLAVPMRASEGNGPAGRLLDPEGHGSGSLPDPPGARPGADRAALRGDDLYGARAPGGRLVPGPGTIAHRGPGAGRSGRDRPARLVSRPARRAAVRRRRSSRSACRTRSPAAGTSCRSPAPARCGTRAHMAAPA